MTKAKGKKRNVERQRNYFRGNYRRSNKNTNFTKELILKVIKHDIIDKELAKKFNTSIQSIQVFRCKFKNPEKYKFNYEIRLK